MNGFGFVEYDDPMDARDVVPGMFQFRYWHYQYADFVMIAFRMMPLPCFNFRMIPGITSSSQMDQCSRTVD